MAVGCCQQTQVTLLGYAASPLGCAARHAAAAAAGHWVTAAPAVVQLARRDAPLLQLGAEPGG